MPCSLLRYLIAELAVVWILLMAGPASAASSAPSHACHAGAELSEDYARVASAPSRWTCGAENWSLAVPRTFILFNQSVRETVPPFFVTRLTKFSAMRLTVVGADGTTASRSVTMADMLPGTADWVMSTPLPRMSVPIRTVLVQIDNPRHLGMLAEARLGGGSDAAGGGLLIEFGIAALCGMLCMPLVFDLAFYRVLRQRFLLCHASAVLFMFAHTAIASGIINRFLLLSLPVLAIGSAFTWALGIVSACLFSADLIEDGKLDRIHRVLLRSTIVWIPLWTCVYLFAGGSARSWAPTAYFGSFVPLLGLFAWVMTVASLRGSRAVRFQIAAMLPLLLTGAVRVASALGMTEVPMELQFEQHLSIALEVIITSLGVTDRFLVIRRDRDRATTQAQHHAFQALHDPLTGLLNRRGLEEQFSQLQDSGFRAMAILDLDHFKQINDSCGHAVGDSVLQVVAEVLAPDDHTLAVRLGGEEFLLLLAGEDIEARADRRRTAIPLRVASILPGLDQMVTASMGIVELPKDDRHRLSFLELYERCDRLLYEAKSGGRNRTCYGRMEILSRFDVKQPSSQVLGLSG